MAENGPYSGPAKAQKMPGDVPNNGAAGFPGNRKEPEGASPTPFIKKCVHPKDKLVNVDAGEQAQHKAERDATAEDVKKLKGQAAYGYGEPNLGPMYVFTDDAVNKKLKQGQTHNSDH